MAYTLPQLQQRRQNLQQQIAAKGGVANAPYLAQRFNNTTSQIQQNRAASPAAGAGNRAATQPGATLAPTAPGGIDALQQQRANILKRIHGMGGAGNTPELTKRLQNVTGQIRTLRKTPATTAPPAPEQAPTPTGEGLATMPGEDSNPAFGPSNEGNVFKSTYDFVPTDYSADPTYNFQKNEGMKALERLYAARGLTNSGAEIEGNTKFLNELGSNTSQRALDIARGDVGRYDQYKFNEADRLERRGDSQFDRLYKVLGLQAQQTPFEKAYDALVKGQGLQFQQGQNKANYVGNDYQKVSGGGGGGGGGGGTPIAPFVPPPRGADYSGLDLLGALNRGNSNGNYLKSIGNAVGKGIDIFSSLFG